MRHIEVTEEYQETAALYALGALSQHEARAFESHLRGGCEVCEEEAAEFEKVVGVLGYGEEPVNAPSYLRDILMGRIEREPQAEAAQVVPLRAERRAAPAVAQPRAMAKAAGGYSVVPWAIAASFAIFSVVSFIAWLQTSGELKVVQTKVEILESQAPPVVRSPELPITPPSDAEVAHLKQRVGELETVNAALSGGAMTITLANQADASQPGVKVYWDKRQGKWLVEGDLPPAPDGKAYQLWLFTADAPTTPIPSKVIETDKAGHAFVTVDLPANIGKLAAAALTLEPATGSTQPTTPIQYQGNVEG